MVSNENCENINDILKIFGKCNDIKLEQVFDNYVSSLQSHKWDMTRKPNCTVVGGTMGHITGPLEMQADDEEEDEEQDEQDEEGGRDRSDCVWKQFSLSLKSKLAFSVLEIAFRAFLLCRPPIPQSLRSEKSSFNGSRYLTPQF